MRTFALVTLGCKVNQYESDMLAGMLLKTGWAHAEDTDSAALTVVNTCTVTGKAAMQSRQAIRRAVDTSPRAFVVATGCHAQTAPHEIERIAGVDMIVGHGDKHRIPDLIPVQGKNAPAAPLTVWREVERSTKFQTPPLVVIGRRTRQFLKIQDGCNTFCTYCIVPYARGRSRSMAPRDVLAHLRELAEAGCSEVVLTGIHLGCYGADLQPKTNLAELLARILASRSPSRVRLSSIEPHELTEEIIRHASASEILCPHFHIPLQSADDRILADMHRPYTARVFAEKVRRIHQRIPDAAVGVDVMAGFPGETEGAFEKCCAMMETLPIAYLHVFPYSLRPGTRAGRLKNPIGHGVIKRRCRVLRDIGEKKKRRFYQKAVGKTHRVLVEEARDPETGLLKGFSGNYVPVRIKGEDRLKNRLVDVRVTGLKGGMPMGIPVLTETFD